MNARRAAWLLLAVLVSVGFAGLGTWQLGRARWKSEYLDAHARALDERAVGFALAATDARLPRRVAGAGRYDDSVTVLLDQRIRDGRLGIDVLTLFRPADGAAPVLVDRGWRPLPGDRTVTPVEPAGDASTDVAGLLVTPPSSGLALGALAFERGTAPPLWPRLELAPLEAALGERLQPAVLLLDDAAPHGYERAWRPLPNTLPPERHRGYALQWFALSATVLVVAALLVFRKR